MSRSKKARVSTFDKCCVCFRNTDSEEPLGKRKRPRDAASNFNNNQSLEFEDDSSTVIGEQLFVIYFINKLLEIPSEICEQYLLKYGHPSEWISLCADCNQIVQEGWKVYKKIMILQKEHKKIQSNVKSLLRIKAENDVEISSVNDTDHIESETTSLDLDNHSTTRTRSSRVKAIKHNRKSKMQSKMESTKDDATYDIRQYLELVGHLSEDLCVDDNFGICGVNGNDYKTEIKIEVEETVDPEFENIEMNDWLAPLPPVEESDSMENSNANVEPYSSNEEMKDNDGSEMSEYCSSDPNIYIDDEDDQDDEDYNEEIETKTRKKNPKPNRIKIKKPKSNKKLKTAIGKKRKPQFTFQEICKLREERDAALKVPNNSQNTSHTGPKFKKKFGLRRLCSYYKVTEFPCSLCSVIFSSYAEWHEHYNIRNCAGEQPVKLKGSGYTCDECGKCITSMQGFEEHVRNVHRPNACLKCEGCNEIFRKTNEFNTHIMKNPDSICAQKAIKCTHSCRNSYFGTKEAFDLHLKIKHTERQPNPYKCEECGKDFMSKGYFNQHLPTHNKLPIKKCPHCDLSFFTNQQLSRHIRSKHEIRTELYPCNFCGKNFKNLGDRDRHHKLHNDLSPYLCTICGKTFKIHNYLTIHMWSHDPDRKLKYSLYKPREKKRKKNVKGSPNELPKNDIEKNTDEGDKDNVQSNHLENQIQQDKETRVIESTSVDSSNLELSILEGIDQFQL